MNNRFVLVGVFVVALGAGYLLVRHAPATQAPPTTDTASSTVADGVSDTASATPTLPKSNTNTTPSVRQTGEAVKTTVVMSVTVDRASLTSSSPYPTVHGTAKNVSHLYVVVSSAATKADITAATISVHDGMWAYPVPVALAPGEYLVTVFVDSRVIVTSPLTVIAQ